jgi:hypothetical protein
VKEISLGRGWVDIGLPSMLQSGPGSKLTPCQWWNAGPLTCGTFRDLKVNPVEFGQYSCRQAGGDRSSGQSLPVLRGMNKCPADEGLIRVAGGSDDGLAVGSPVAFPGLEKQ